MPHQYLLYLGFRFLALRILSKSFLSCKPPSLCCFCYRSLRRQGYGVCFSRGCWWLKGQEWRWSHINIFCSITRGLQSRCHHPQLRCKQCVDRRCGTGLQEDIQTTSLKPIPRQEFLRQATRSKRTHNLSAKSSCQLCPFMLPQNS